MLYSLLIHEVPGIFEDYDDTNKEQVMKLHRDLQAEAESKGIMAVAQLLPTSSAVTVRATPDNKPMVIDGPFAETKEMFVGIYLLECETLEQAIQYASKLANPCHTIEVRPVKWSGGILATDA